MLKVDHLSYSYKKIQALRDVSFELRPGEIMAIIGANGAGKSTLMKCIAGVLRPSNGHVTLNGEVLPPRAHEVVKRRMVLVPEGRWIFPGLTIEENLEIGAYTVSSSAEGKERAFSMFPKLKERRRQRAGTLSGGEQQMLAMGRAMMSEPKLLMLDEPSMGLAPILVEQIFDIIRELHKSGATILLVEQNAQMALQVANRAYVLETGKITLAGSGKELLESDSIKKAYLGG